MADDPNTQTQQERPSQVPPERDDAFHGDAQPGDAGPETGERQARPCPYCGHVGDFSAGREQCSNCKGWFEPLSRQASQNAMGPWYFHDDAVPFRPGCSYETLKRLIAKGRVTAQTIIRGPGTNQFWMYAVHAPGVAHLLGRCHSCRQPVSAEAFMCDHCGATLPTYEDRQHLGLAPVRLLPGQAHATRVAATAMRSDARDSDPGDSDYGPIAPTFASAAVEEATARAESAGAPAPVSRSASEETVDEPVQIAPGQTRRERRYARMRTLVGVLIAVATIQLIVIGALVLRSGPSQANASGESAPNGAAPTPASSAEIAAPSRDWATELERAESLIATGAPAQMGEALSILRSMRAQAPVSQMPEDIDRRIERLAERLESVRLRNYLEQSDLEQDG